eukprot:NODE_5295_length_960_cov_117.323775_g5080_i0.p1 GENE.NODE_5295_length_960_cov_117.323775_g5080_i0~~NODE_5295_length_960_cov_117.323775_g5080_i0.p1  ORF type:complete len:198 (-),score=28.28 NODE_5295_length_960_cov_117.323775_g5080_i0:295-888(-)
MSVAIALPHAESDAHDGVEIDHVVEPAVALRKPRTLFVEPADGTKPVLHFDLTESTPEHIEVRGTAKDGHSLHTRIPIKAGEVVFSNTSLLLPMHFDLTVSVCGETFTLDPLLHTVNRKDCREYFGFDSFMNHNCDPNCKHVYEDGKDDTCYQIIAKRDLEIGDEIQCDYYDFDECLDGTEFDCKCGATNCRGLIKG